MPNAVPTLTPDGRYRRFKPYRRYDRTARQLRYDRSQRYDPIDTCRLRVQPASSTRTEGVFRVRLLQQPFVIRRIVVAACALIAMAGTVRGVETTDVVLRPDIEFATQAAVFEPISGNYSNDEELVPPESRPAPSSSSADGDDSTERNRYDSETYSPAPILEPSGCDPGGVFTGDAYEARARQIPDNWLWGCNGSAYRTGPGNCDDWKVGCRWETSVDGLMLFRPDADLASLQAATNLNSEGMPLGDPIIFDQFDYSAGGRVSFTGRYPRCAGYEVQAAYEGINEWNASIVYPKEILDPTPGVLLSEQSSLFYTSVLQSAELNILRRCDGVNRWFGGVRYLRFKDEINYVVDQEAIPPEPVTDQVMINDLNNNLIGFQIGGRHDLWRPHRRFTLEGFFNAGVYYNYIQRYDEMTTTTLDNGVLTTTNVSKSEPSQIAYVGEASITGVCKLNRCWACRAGYQVLWIDGLSLAQDAFLNTGVDSASLTFQGWHFGVECRR